MRFKIKYQQNHGNVMTTSRTSLMTCSLIKLLPWFILSLSLLYNFYSIKFQQCSIVVKNIQQLRDPIVQNLEEENKKPENTGLHHLVFGIGGSSDLWNHRKNYVKLWWRPGAMRGAVWLDKMVDNGTDDHLLPQVKISTSTSNFKYENPQGNRSAIRLTRIVSESLKLAMEDVRWFVMGDDDTLFIPDNLVRILSKYDHNQYYYIGSTSESHSENIIFNYGMAYGGGGFALSYPLAQSLAKMQDRCIERYPSLYGSDDRIHACMSELGVPLTKEPGFHQIDLRGSLFGLLTAHPITPLVTLHHFDLVEPIFPNVDKFQALERLMVPAKLDSAALMQQSICYDKARSLTISISWGYAVQIFRGILYPREVEMVARTFLSWHRTADPYAFAFNNRPYVKNRCQKPFVYFYSDASYNNSNEILSEYVRN